ncbi:MAG: CPBP family intramembrane glutamic endopeptidase [Chloroflexota bacterium]
MATSKRRNRKKKAATAVNITIIQVLIACVVPIIAGILLQTLAAGEFRLQPGNNAPMMAGIGLGSWVLGLRWFGITGLGLRGRRPLFSSIGFATLGWIVLFAVRFFFISLDPGGMNPSGAGRIFLYMLLFEGFAIQLWAFGLLFRVFTEWRGGLPAVFGSGAMFGLAAFALFHEGALGSDFFALVYFIAWGALYGIIRLRTGSILGSVLIQALHSFTVWEVLAAPNPLPAADVANLPQLFIVAAVGYAIIIWRLWPKELDDYRI